MDRRDPTTLKLYPFGVQNEYQIDTKSIKYATLTHSKTNSDFELILTFLLHQNLIAFETRMGSTCVKSYVTSKHCNHKTHSKYIGFYRCLRILVCTCLQETLS